jgi:hypothetical protein
MRANVACSQPFSARAAPLMPQSAVLPTRDRTGG